jgi:hypothetical protein
MEGFISDLWFEMNSKIELAKNQNTKYVPVAIKIIESYIEQLKEFIDKNEFQSIPEEIYFFKILKPRFCSMLIYYAKVQHYEMEKPVGSIEEKKEHINAHLNNLTRYFKKHLTFYQYIKNENTHLDEIYFIRSNAKKNVSYDNFTIDIDFRYCTGYDNRIAVFQANENLEKYFYNEMNLLLNPVQNAIQSHIPQNTHYETDYEKFNLHWTESQSALTELIYALHESKVFNEGETTILDITKCLEMAFNVRLSNVHRSFVEIKNRKNERLKFLDGLVNRLNSFIERSFQK